MLMLFRTSIHKYCYYAVTLHKSNPKKELK
jgi:hypothetical protein